MYYLSFQQLMGVVGFELFEGYLYLINVLLISVEALHAMMVLLFVRTYGYYLFDI